MQSLIAMIRINNAVLHKITSAFLISTVKPQPLLLTLRSLDDFDKANYEQVNYSAKKEATVRNTLKQI